MRRESCRPRWYRRSLSPALSRAAVDAATLVHARCVSWELVGVRPRWGPIAASGAAEAAPAADSDRAGGFQGRAIVHEALPTAAQRRRRGAAAGWEVCLRAYVCATSATGSVSAPPPRAASPLRATPWELLCTPSRLLRSPFWPGGRWGCQLTSHALRALAGELGIRSPSAAQRLSLCGIAPSCLIHRCALGAVPHPPRSAPSTA